MTLETLTTKFETLSAAVATRDAGQAAYNAGQALVTAAIVDDLAAYLAARTLAQSANNFDALQSALWTTSAAAAAALADYASAFAEFQAENQ